MPDSDTTLVRRELVTVTHRLMAAETEYARHAEDTSAKIAGLQGTVDRLRTENAGLQGTVDRLRTELAEKRGRGKADNAAPAPQDGAPAPQDGAPAPQDGIRDAKEKEIKSLKAQLGITTAKLEKAERELAVYNNHNRPGAEVYNRARDNLRRTDGTYDSDPTGNKTGAVKGHPGVSHSRKAEETRRYPIRRCASCKMDAYLVGLRPANKLYHYLDNGRARTACISAARAWCANCDTVSTADSPSIRGTHMGESMLGLVGVYASRSAVDADISAFMDEGHGFYVARSTVLAARTSLADIFEPSYNSIMDYLVDVAPYVHRDETPIRINGRWGYVWLVCWNDAVYMVCAHSRGRAVLDLHFSRLVGKPSVTDQYVAYETLVIRQACLVHILRHCESVVIRERANAELQRSLENGGDGEGTGAGAEAGGTGAGAEADKAHRLYLRLRSLYRLIKSIDTASEEEIVELDRQIGEIAAEYGEGHPMHTALVRAKSNMLVCLQYSGMSCDNNRAEREMHAGPCMEKRARHQLKNSDGMRRLSILCSVFRTCKHRGIRITDAVAAAARDPNWNMFSQPATGPPGGRTSNGRRALRDAVTYVC